MLMANKTGLPEQQVRASKYFKYAVGEIILVMIGILLALQVNDWNNKRLEVSKEQLFLKNLQVEFKANLVEFNEIYNRSTTAYIASNSLLNIIKEGGENLDNKEIDSLINIIINDFSSLDLTDGSINEIINTGSLNIIKDQKLRNQLSNWSQAMNDMNDDINITIDYLFNIFIPSLTEKALLRNTKIPQRIIENTGLSHISESNFKIDYSNTLINYEFENQVYFNALNYMFTLNAYKITEAYLIETLELIEDNIED